MTPAEIVALWISGVFLTGMILITWKIDQLNKKFFKKETEK